MLVPLRPDHSIPQTPWPRYVGQGGGSFSPPGAANLATNQGMLYPASINVDMKPANRLLAEQYKNAGNELRKCRQYDQALLAYNQSIQADPRFTDAYFNLAQLWVLKGNVSQAINTLSQLLAVDPNDYDARVMLGEYFEKVGNTQEAKKRYMEVLGVRPDFDPARRHLNYLLFLDQQRFFPDTAQQLLKTQYHEVVYKARELLKEYYTQFHRNPVLLELSQNVPIVFEPTQNVNDTPNIAEWDVKRGVIRVQPEMLFSTYLVLGAYLAHELVHSVDGDGRSSIREEQEGYRELAKFWGRYRAAENDPNLDRALELYTEGPDNLDHEVRRVYTIRDVTMPETSSSHGKPSTSAQGQRYTMYETNLSGLSLQQLQSVLGWSSQPALTSLQPSQSHAMYPPITPQVAVPPRTIERMSS